MLVPNVRCPKCNSTRMFRIRRTLADKVFYRKFWKLKCDQCKFIGRYNLLNRKFV